MDLNSMLNQFMCDGNIDEDAVNRMMNGFSGGGFGSIGLIILFIILLCCCCSGGYGQGLGSPFGNLFGFGGRNQGPYPQPYPNYGYNNENCYTECCCKCEPCNKFNPCDDSGCDCCCSRKKRKKCRKAWRKYKKYRCECQCDCEPEFDCCDSCCECCNDCLNQEQPQYLPPPYNPYGCGIGGFGGIWCIIIILIIFCCCSGGGFGSFLGDGLFRRGKECCN
ncbi:hypothetical protein [Hathewaya massiliensis]|uniref:hypothetical protein n=1 Tax=Hathewaya massiliensis TaxID=1964382 RepID=UPI0011579D2E|nr:hypothetical protein [Hathewaya massiliensis]